MINYDALYNLVHVRTKALRNIYHAIQNIDFKEAWASAPKEERDALLHLIDAHDDSAVWSWIRRQNQGTLYDMPVRDLRSTAKALGVTNVNSLNRDELLTRIKAEQDKRSARRDAGSDPESKGSDEKI